MSRLVSLVGLAGLLVACSGTKPDSAEPITPSTGGLTDPGTPTGTPGGTNTGSPGGTPTGTNTGTVAPIAPTITLLSPADLGQYPSGSPLLVEVEVVDPDTPNLQTLQLSWTGAANVPEAPLTTDASGSAVFYLTSLPVGPHALTVTVTDGDGLTDNENAAFEIVDNDADGDGYPAATDCDDTNAAINPGAVEICDTLDNDCDLLVDEADPSLVATTWYPDTDADGQGDLNDPGTVACTQPAGTVDNADDCDDSDPDTYDGALEQCNGVDNDCDGTADNGVVDVPWYEDSDGDGYGNPLVSLLDCAQPVGFVSDDTDCDDAAYAVNPGATEVCNGIDDDCFGGVDDGVLLTFYDDADNDGYGNPAAAQQACTQPAGTVVDNTDCNDGNGGINPGAAEVCNGLDDNCAAGVDEGVTTPYYADTDGDGQGNPYAVQDACTQPPGHVPNNTDCDDSTNLIYLGAPELCDGLDNDCNGVVDNGAGATDWYLDADMDGFGDPTTSQSSCTQPPGYVADNSDCNDGDGNVFPGQTETCNGIDDNCANGADEGVQNLYYQDADGDFYGNPGAITQGCVAPPGYVTDNTDCNDTLAYVNPGAVEVCNGYDDDCDGPIDEDVQLPFYADTDNDTFGDPGNLTSACTAPPGFVANDTDCDDTNPAVNPNGTETCNGIDDNCSGFVDDAPGGCAASCPVYADPNVLPGGDGSYANPFPSIAYAIAFRGVGCDDIVLLPGTYDEQVDYGGEDLSITTSGGPGVTSLTSSVGGTLVTFANGETPAALLEGLTLTGGDALTGGGVSITGGSSPTLRGNVITGNTASDGAGVYIQGGAPVLENNVFEGNTCTDDGSALYMTASDAIVRDNEFRANHANDEGAAIWSGGFGNPQITGNLFEDNTTNSDSTVWLDDGTPLFANNLMVNNGGSGLYLYDDNSGLIANNTIADSAYANLRTASYPTARVLNNLFYSGGIYDVRFQDTVTLTGLTYENNTAWGAGTPYYVSNPTGTDGNHSVDPRFVGGGDYTLLWDSRAIDSGTDLTADGVTADYAGNPRPRGAAYDRGAFETWGETPTCPGSTYCATGCPVYVSAAAVPGGNGDPATPYPSIAYAQTYANGCTDIVLGPGVYDENVDFGATEWTLTSTDGAALTTLESTVGGIAMSIQGGQTRAALVDGITISGGDTTTGGGLRITGGSSPTVSNCVISGNSASDGGGIYASGGAPLFEDNTFTGNSVTDDGGAIYMTGCDAEIRNNLFDANHSNDEGAAIWSGGFGDPIITGNTFTDNTTNSDSTVWLDDGTPLFANNLMVNNGGSGLYLYDDNSGLIAHNTVVDSAYANLRTASYPTARVINNLFYSGGIYDVRFQDTVTLTALTYENNLAFGAGTPYYVSNPTGTDGNISLNPMFVGGGDYTLLWGSWAIDTGQDLTADGLVTDLLGNPRPRGPTTDLGAYETWGDVQGCPGGPYCATTCPVYVDPTTVPGGNGSAGSPFPTIGYAMTYANGCTDIVLGPGTYDENVDYGSTDWSITSTAGAAATILQSDIGGIAVSIQGGQTNAALLDGVTITGGDTPTGGGIRISGSSSPTITNNIVQGNTASDGGGLYISGGAPVVQFNHFEGNTSTDDGGAIYMTGSDARIQDNTFLANHSNDEGAAIWSGGFGDPVITHNEIRDNTTNSDSTVWLDDGIPLFANNLLVNNGGSGIYLYDDNSGLIANNTVVDSAYANLRTASYPPAQVLNNIFYSGGIYDVRFQDTVTLTALTYEDNNAFGAGTVYYVSNPTGTDGNISIDPLFVAPGSDDYSLQFTSNCTDSGQNLSLVGVMDDYFHTARPLGLGFDMGAIESW